MTCTRKRRRKKTKTRHKKPRLPQAQSSNPPVHLFRLLPQARLARQDCQTSPGALERADKRTAGLRVCGSLIACIGKKGVVSLSLSVFVPLFRAALCVCVCGPSEGIRGQAGMAGRGGGCRLKRSHGWMRCTPARPFRPTRSNRKKDPAAPGWETWNLPACPALPCQAACLPEMEPLVHVGLNGGLLLDGLLTEAVCSRDLPTAPRGEGGGHPLVAGQSGATKQRRRI